MTIDVPEAPAGAAGPDLTELVALFERPLARTRYNESVTQLEHALQCAWLAHRADAGHELAAAALLHDVGHLLTVEETRTGRPSDDLLHENVGSRFLARWFGPRVTGPVALHVAAKRYLCATDDAYLRILSPGSVHSLELQGGPMSSSECEAFEALEGWQGAVQLRRWDDLAKRPGASCPPLEEWWPVLEGLTHR
jgi:phosphonate degradation associated HDIG domain protein